MLVLPWTLESHALVNRERGQELRSLPFFCLSLALASLRLSKLSLGGGCSARGVGPFAARRKETKSEIVLRQVGASFPFLNAAAEVIRRAPESKI